jgi:hypothetical protein
MTKRVCIPKRLKLTGIIRTKEDTKKTSSEFPELHDLLEED